MKQDKLNAQTGYQTVAGYLLDLWLSPAIRCNVVAIHSAAAFARDNSKFTDDGSIRQRDEVQVAASWLAPCCAQATNCQHAASCGCLPLLTAMKASQQTNVQRKLTLL